MGTSDMVDMRVRDDNRFDLQLMLLEHFRDLVDLLARIDDDCFMRLLVAENGAVALEETDRQDDVDHLAGQSRIERWTFQPSLLFKASTRITSRRFARVEEAKAEADTGQ